MKTTETRTSTKVSRNRKPLGMTLEEWQIALRRNFSREQKLKLKELGNNFFQVANPKSGGKYQVRIRGRQLGDNHCTCPDFQVNTLGTCKHVEFVLGKIERRRKGNARVVGEKAPRSSEILLRYGAKREIFFRPGAKMPKNLQEKIGKFFSPDGALKRERYLNFDQFLKHARALDPEIHCQEEALSFIAQVRDQSLLRQRVAERFPNGVESSAFKSLLKTTLYPYQRSGALFAASTGRCVIADDMGL